MKNNPYSIKNCLFAVFLGVLCFNAVEAGSPEWLEKIKKTEVLKTTKAEIERSFGNPEIVETDDLAVKYKNGWGKKIKYETGYGRLEIRYAAGKCAENKGKPYAYDVPAEIAMTVTFFPHEIVLENELGYNLSKFKAESGSETGKTYSLENEKSQIKIDVKNFQVSYIEYDIPEKYKTRLECKNVTVKEPVWFESLRTFELFKSTRREVEALFDNPPITEIDDTVGDGDDWSIEVTYTTGAGELRARYSTGKCFERQSKYGYDAARNTIVELIFVPSGKFDATELDFDFRKFKSDSTFDGVRKTIPELSLGVFLSEGRINSVEISPNDKQDDEFDCSGLWNPQK